jgi:hypothetical protein
LHSVPLLKASLFCSFLHTTFAMLGKAPSRYRKPLIWTAAILTEAIVLPNISFRWVR